MISNNNKNDDERRKTINIITGASLCTIGLTMLLNMGVSDANRVIDSNTNGGASENIQETAELPSPMDETSEYLYGKSDMADSIYNDNDNEKNLGKYRLITYNGRFVNSCEIISYKIINSNTISYTDTNYKNVVYSGTFEITEH